MNPIAFDIKDMLVAEGGFAFGVDLFINQQPPTPTNATTIYDTSANTPEDTLDGEDTFLRDTVMLLVRNETYAGAHTTAQTIINVLHKKARETWNETFYLHINLLNGPNALGSGQMQTGGAGDTIQLSLNFQALRIGAAYTGAPGILKFLQFVNTLIAGTNTTFAVDSVAETITINSTGSGGGIDFSTLVGMLVAGTDMDLDVDAEAETITFNFTKSVYTQTEVNNLLQGVADMIPTDINELSDTSDLLGDKNVIEEVQVDGVALPVINKAVNVELPQNLSDFNNDEGFIENIQDASDVDTANIAVGKMIEVFEVGGGFVHQYIKLITTESLIIAVADWSGGLTCTKLVAGLKVGKSVDIIIESQTEGDKWADGNLYALPITVDGQISFTAETTPTADITIKLRIWAQ